MRYEESEVTLARGDGLLLYSDGLVEAHNPSRDMFGFPRLKSLVGAYQADPPMIEYLLAQLHGFVGTDWEQEDDVTLVTVQWTDGDDEAKDEVPLSAQGGGTPPASAEEAWRDLGEVTVASEPGNERQAIAEVARLIEPLHLPTKRLEALKTAVGEATMNAMEHGNHYRADLPVFVRVRASQTTLSVSITDHGGGRPIPEAHEPDLEAKLAELQTPRGWGLFLIKNMVDDMRVSRDGHHHTIELIMYLGGESHAE
jgi:anti-sigma regulatory factor (Ser/Thr protein kinase)